MVVIAVGKLIMWTKEEIKMVKILTILMVLLTSEYGFAEITTTKLETLPNVAWERNFNDNYRECNSVGISPKTNELILAGDLSANRNKEKGIWFWRVDSEGNKTTDVVIKQLTFENKTVKLLHLFSMLINDDESVWLIAEADFPRTILLRITPNGDILMSRRITGGIDISKGVLLPGNEVLIVGNISGKASFMKFDATGKEVWKKTSNHSGFGKYYDGIPSKDGGFVLVENSGSSNSFVVDSKEIYLSKFSANGEKITENKLSGKLGNIVKGQDGSVALLYDRNATEGLGYWINKYDIGLNFIWSSNVAEHEYSIENLNMSLVSNMDYILSGQTFGDFKGFMAFVDSNGNKKWEYYSKIRTAGPKILCIGAVCYLVDTTLNTLDAEYNPITQIKITKFQL